MQYGANDYPNIAVIWQLGQDQYSLEVVTNDDRWYRVVSRLNVAITGRSSKFDVACDELHPYGDRRAWSPVTLDVGSSSSAWDAIKSALAAIDRGSSTPADDVPHRPHSFNRHNVCHTCGLSRQFAEA